jgi:hypothetical protein
VSGGGSSSGGNDAAQSPGGSSFGGLTGVTAPLTGLGTAGNPLAMPAASAGQAGYMTAAQVAQLAGNTGQGWLARTIARAVSKAGFSSDEAIALCTVEAGGINFAATATDTWTQVDVGGGSADYSSGNGDRGGLVRINRTVTNGTIHLQRNCSGFLEGNGTTGKKFYYRARKKFGSLAGAGASIILAAGFSNNFAHASFIDVGIVAANSTAKYSARVTGTTTVNLISTVNVDLNCHWFELWSDGTNLFLSVDDEAAVSGAYVVFTPSLRPNLCYVSDATAGTRTMHIDRALWATEQAT